MSETPSTTTNTDKPPAAEANGQLIVALVTVGGLVILGVALLVAGVILKDGKEAYIGVGVIAGGLINSLTSPTGISNVLRAAKSGTGGQ